MPKRNLENPPKERAAPPVDSLGRLRVYLDVDRRLATGLKMLAAISNVNQRQMVEEILRAAILTNPAVAEACGLGVVKLPAPKAIKIVR